MPMQYQIEQHVGIDEVVAQYMMRGETPEARTAMGALKLAMTSADRPTMAILQAAVDDCKRKMREQKEPRPDIAEQGL